MRAELWVLVSWGIALVGSVRIASRSAGAGAPGPRPPTRPPEPHRKEVSHRWLSVQGWPTPVPALASTIGRRRPARTLGRAEASGYTVATAATAAQPFTDPSGERVQRSWPTRGRGSRATGSGRLHLGGYGPPTDYRRSRRATGGRPASTVLASRRAGAALVIVKAAAKAHEVQVGAHLWPLADRLAARSDTPGHPRHRDRRSCCRRQPRPGLAPRRSRSTCSATR